MARIFYVNNLGGGYADHTEIVDGMTVQAFFEQRLPDARAEDYLIRVNRLPASRDQRLADGDRVTITPIKVDGAQRVR
jgi:hypothetical protein